MPQHGLGSKLSRTSWTDDCYWTIARVKLSPVSQHRHNRALGPQRRQSPPGTWG